MNPHPPPSLHERSPWWQYFTPEEKQDLLGIPPHDLTPEIRLLTAGQLQLFEEEQRAPSRDRQQLAQNLIAFGNAAVCIGLMERTRLKVRGSSSRWDSAIQQAYKFARQQMDVENYLPESPEPEHRPERSAAKSNGAS